MTFEQLQSAIEQYCLASAAPADEADRIAAYFVDRIQTEVEPFIIEEEEDAA